MREIHEDSFPETSDIPESERNNAFIYGGRTSDGTLEQFKRESEGSCGFNEIPNSMWNETDNPIEEDLDSINEQTDAQGVGFDCYEEDLYEYSSWDISTEPVEVSDGTLACLEFFSSDRWDTLGTEERAEATETLADHLAEDLGIRFKPNIRFYEEPLPYDYGQYSTENNTIYINFDNMGDGGMAAGIIAYEMRRCWQCEKANNPQCLRDQIFWENLEHYVSPVDDMQAYRSQPVERDARAYAKGVADLV